MSGLTGSDLEFIDSAPTERLQQELRWARREGDDVYASALAHEILKRSTPIAAGAIGLGANKP